MGCVLPGLLEACPEAGRGGENWVGIRLKSAMGLGGVSGLHKLREVTLETEIRAVGRVHAVERRLLLL